MTEKQRKITRLIYGIVMSLLTIAAGVLLIVQSQRIYHSPNPYSREIVGAYLETISPVLYIWIAAVVVGAILWQVIPPEKKKLRGTIYSTDLVVKMKGRMPEGASSPLLDKSALVKKIVWGVAISFSVLTVIMVGLVVWDNGNYHLGNSFNPTNDLLNMLPKFMPWVAAAFALAIGVAVYDEISAKREIAEIKKIIAESKKNPDAVQISTKSAKKKIDIRVPEKFKDERFRRYAILGTRIALLIASIVLVIVGIVNGGLRDVLEKAAAICSECIGLG